LIAAARPDYDLTAHGNEPGIDVKPSCLPVELNNLMNPAQTLRHLDYALSTFFLTVEEHGKDRLQRDLHTLVRRDSAITVVSLMRSTYSSAEPPFALSIICYCQTISPPLDLSSVCQTARAAEASLGTSWKPLVT
jgi:hypothetical protein